MRHSSMAREQRAPLGGRRSAWVGIRIHSPNPCGIEVAIVLSTSVDSLISKLHDIQEAGWHKNARTGNDGGVGNTLEDLLGIRENNLAAPDLDGWEIKCQRKVVPIVKTAGAPKYVKMGRGRRAPSERHPSRARVAGPSR